LHKIGKNAQVFLEYSISLSLTIKKMKRRNLIKRSIAGLLLLIILTCLGVGTYFFNYAIAGHSDTAVPDGDYFSKVKESCAEWIAPEHIERLTVTSDDGLRLNGYFFPADLPTKQLAIVVHGHRDGALRMLDYAKMFHSMGFNVFAADNRAHDSSEGRYAGFGWLDRKDYLRWMDLLIKKIGSDAKIVLHGVSMGGATVMMLSGETSLPSQVVAVIEDCGFTSVEEEFDYQAKTFYHLPPFPFVTIADLESQIFAGYGFAEASALKQVAKSRIPIMFIHGDSDRYVPTFMAYQLYDAARCEKTLWIVEGAAHAKAFYTATDEYKKRVEEFLETF